MTPPVGGHLFARLPGPSGPVWRRGVYLEKEQGKLKFACLATGLSVPEGSTFSVPSGEESVLMVVACGQESAIRLSPPPGWKAEGGALPESGRVLRAFFRTFDGEQFVTATEDEESEEMV